MSVPEAAGRAVLVAVETYEAGSGWDLDGPVRDSLAYRAWLLELGLAPDSVTHLAAPLPGNRGLLEESGVRWRPADRENVHRALFRETAGTPGDWLCVAWSGHGLVGLDGHRRLLYVDAVPNDLRSLDLEDALAAFRSDLAPALPRQLWLVDACQTFADAATAGDALRPDPVPRGRLRPGHQQGVVFACGPGGTTLNRAPGTAPGGGTGAPSASGAFSAAALHLLRTHPHLRHDAVELGRALRDRLRSASAAPTALWFEGGGLAVRAEADRSTSRRRLGIADHRRLYEALAAVPVMRDPGLRAAVIGRLPSALCASVPRSAVMRMEILELIDTCLLFENGLGHLWEAVALFDAGTVALDGLLSVLKDYPEWFSTE
ncbi:hypothetical protein [Streptomyces sp. NPDC058739]|uniref:effector-associated domain 2-containing protein n=1 Tax=Streptomyces sp. NPDC058739 TaxID=3346618 RepID=UPI0036AB1480